MTHLRKKPHGICHRNKPSSQEEGECNGSRDSEEEVNESEMENVNGQKCEKWLSRTAATKQGDSGRSRQEP